MLRRPIRTSPPRFIQWAERVMAAIALLNLTLALLDYSYIPLRDYYLRLAPRLTLQYGETFKGIEPHRSTQAYLNTLDQLDPEAFARGNADDQVLRQLRHQSRAMIDENPFEGADKTGTLERIKQRMVDYVSEATNQDIDSSKVAFDRFWSQRFLTPATYEERLAFFNAEIRPLIATNYFRNIDAPLIGTSGIPVDRFIIIDLGFMVLFMAEFLLRTAVLSRRLPRTNWLDAMLWRWYDIPLFLPFWRWLRVIPVLMRVNHSRLINLNPIRDRLTRGFLSSIAIELTEIVVLRIIDQAQNMIRDGDARKIILAPDALGPRYLDLNGIDEIQVITERLIHKALYDVLPKAQPDIENVLRHTILSVLSQNPVYSQLQFVPGVSDLSGQLSSQLSNQLYTTIYDGLTHAVEDEEGAQLISSLVDKLGGTFRVELQRDQDIGEIEALMDVWLEEIKASYVKRLADEDIERLRQEAQHIYAITQQPKN